MWPSSDASDKTIRIRLRRTFTAICLHHRNLLKLKSCREDIELVATEAQVTAADFQRTVAAAHHKPQNKLDYGYEQNAAARRNTINKPFYHI